MNSQQEKATPPGKLKSIWQNPWTFTGAALTFVAILFFVSFQLLEAFRPVSNPYTGIWTFLVFPAILVVGLILIPIGYLRERTRRRRLFPGITEWPRYPTFDPNNPSQRRGLLIAAAGTLVIIPLIGISSYQGYHYTDSTQFCGQVCHEVMNPEFMTYRDSPHARVSCAACHIGPGADWYVKSKISGLRQVLAVMLNTYSRPIPTPIVDLRPARETCEQCHWPEKFFGAQLRTRVHFRSDEENTRQEIRVLVKTGGADSSMGAASGIHWHMALSHKIEYIASDPSRQTIPWVRATDGSGRVSIYRSDGKTSQDPPPPGEIRRVDCMDCHNRPSHVIHPPDRALNISLESGRIDRTLPSIKKIAAEALTIDYSSEQEADERISSYIRKAYEEAYPAISEQRRSDINQAIDETRAIYRRNFFPQMKVHWKAYPDNIGHMIFDGCFRCHDDRHISNDKGPIRKDCGVCHEFQEEVLIDSEQHAFRQAVPMHPYKLEGIHAELKCTACHSGGRAPLPSCEGCHTAQLAFREGKGPVLPGLEGTPPSVMADLGCDSCHDLSEPLTAVASQCEVCHEKGYADMVAIWKEDAKSGRSEAAEAIEQLKGSLGLGQQEPAADAALRKLIHEMQQAMSLVDQAGAQHNLDFADATWKRIVELAKEGPKATAPDTEDSQKQ